MLKLVTYPLCSSHYYRHKMLVHQNNQDIKKQDRFI